MNDEALPQLHPRDQASSQHLVERSERGEIVVGHPAHIENRARRPCHRNAVTKTRSEQVRIERLVHCGSNNRMAAMTRSRDLDAAGWSESIKAVHVRRRSVRYNGIFTRSENQTERTLFPTSRRSDHAVDAARHDLPTPSRDQSVDRAPVQSGFERLCACDHALLPLSNNERSRHGVGHEPPLP
jgi:hypothetical protein